MTRAAAGVCTQIPSLPGRTAGTGRNVRPGLSGTFRAGDNIALHQPSHYPRYWELPQRSDPSQPECHVFLRGGLFQYNQAELTSHSRASLLTVCLRFPSARVAPSTGCQSAASPPSPPWHHRPPPGSTAASALGAHGRPRRCTAAALITGNYNIFYVR